MATIDELSENEIKVLRIIKNMQEDGDYVVDGGGILCNWGNPDNLPVTVEALNIKGKYVEWLYCETVREAKETLHELKIGHLTIGKPLPKTRIMFYDMIVE